MSRVVRRRWQTGVAVALAATWSALAPPDSAAATASMAFELPMLDGSQFVHLADFSGQPVLLNFWGSECPPCVKEMPLLISQARDYPGVQFLGIAVDDKASAQRFLERLRPGYPQLIVPRQADVLMRRFGNKLGALPYTVVLNALHQVCTSRLGEIDAQWVSTAMVACAVDRAEKSTVPAETAPLRISR